jgi:hypothetical protein
MTPYLQRLRGLLLVLGWTLAGLALCSTAQETAALTVERPPRIFPDYVGTTIPAGIAPLNFKVLEPGSRYKVVIRSTQGKPVQQTQSSPLVRIPSGPWKLLLSQNVGQPLLVEVSVQNAQRQWQRFGIITNTIAPDGMDGYLAYRLLKPLYNIYVEVGIYQRNLGNFDQKPILENKALGGGCLNCHTFLDRRPDTFALHIRAESKPMLLVQSNQVSRVDKPMGYMSWHPSGRLIAFSANKLSLFYHTMGETRDVFDADSNLGIYRVDSNTFVNPPPIALTDQNETWPSWSADGKHLYYCSATKAPAGRFRTVRYDLMRVSYDLEKDQWGQPEVVVAARENGLSAGQPRVSPDGKWLLYCLYKYGNFPIYQPSSDLYVMDLATRKQRRLEINSDVADSWHSWSGNSRWVVFSSKRIDGLFARPHFTYVDANGRFHKPFVLPQADPSFYEKYLNTFNVPEFMEGPVRIKPEDLARAVGTGKKASTLKSTRSESGEQ